MSSLLLRLNGHSRLGEGGSQALGTLAVTSRCVLLDNFILLWSTEFSLCFIQGGLEFLTRASTLSDPCYTVRPTNIPAHLPSVHMMAVDILPSSLPLDASKHFSDAMFPYLQSLIREYRGEKEEEGGYREALNRATIARAGELVGRHKWLEEPLSAWGDSVALTEVDRSVVEKPGNEPGVMRKKKVLMLGSGMVAGPAVQEICKRGDVELLVG